MPNIYKATLKDIKNMSLLASRIYLKYASYLDSEKGKKSILDYASEKEMTKRFSKKGSLFLVYKMQSNIIGMLEVRDNTHISMFFVDDNFFKKGIATSLFEKMKNILNYEHYSVNASEYALEFYKKLGFIKLSDDIKIEDGVHFHPMIY